MNIGALGDAWMDEYSDFRPKQPKWDQNLQFTSLSETTSIPVTFFMGVKPPDIKLPKQMK